MINSVINGDCLEVMQDIPSKSIDMILCDLPYGTTACSWDVVIPFDKLWGQYERIIKDNGAIVLTASQPFTSALVMSNPKLFKYELIWNKIITGNPLLGARQPLKIHENILIFYKAQPIYNKQHTELKSKETIARERRKMGSVYSNSELYKNLKKTKTDSIYKNPVSILKISKELGSNQFVKNPYQHPTKKPVSLFEYLIKTYTNEGDLVLDNCAGSGTTAIACINQKRNYILIEKEERYFNMINKRIEEHTKQLKLL